MVASKSKKSKRLPIYVLNGPNLNLLGTREPEVYGRATLAEIGKMVTARAKALGFGVVFRQTNHEGKMVDWLQEARTSSCGVILNAAAFTHTSVAVLDALLMLAKPLVEVHLSIPQARDRFRHHSHVSKVATGTICGFGAEGYGLAVDALAHILKERTA